MPQSCDKVDSGIEAKVNVPVGPRMKRREQNLVPIAIEQKIDARKAGEFSQPPSLVDKGRQIRVLENFDLIFFESEVSKLQQRATPRAYRTAIDPCGHPAPTAPRPAA